MKIIYKILIFLIVLMSTINSFALSPEPKLSDPVLEKQAMELFTQVRCLVCNGQVIESSETKFAYDMREFIRNEIKNGKTNEEIKHYLTETFGNDIITSPNKSLIIVFLIISLIISALISIAFFPHIFLNKTNKSS